MFVTDWDWYCILIFVMSYWPTSPHHFVHPDNRSYIPQFWMALCSLLVPRYTFVLGNQINVENIPNRVDNHNNKTIVMDHSYSNNHQLVLYHRYNLVRYKSLDIPILNTVLKRRYTVVVATPRHFHQSKQSIYHPLVYDHV